LGKRRSDCASDGAGLIAPGLAELLGFCQQEP
jgi:hypothetical protein